MPKCTQKCTQKCQHNFFFRLWMANYRAKHYFLLHTINALKGKLMFLDIFSASIYKTRKNLRCGLIVSIPHLCTLTYFSYQLYNPSYGIYALFTLHIYSCPMKTHKSSDAHRCGLSKAVQSCVIYNYYLGQMQCFRQKNKFQ